MISRTQLRNLLNLESVEDETVKIKFSSHGPGQLDKWGSLLYGKENCWQQRFTDVKPVEKKRIIFSYALLTQFLHDVTDFDFISALVSEYDVYLWQGPHKKFSDSKPVTNAEEFWKLLPQVYPGNESDVKEALSKEGLSTKDFLVIDRAKYVDIIRKPQVTTALTYTEKNKFVYEIDKTLQDRLPTQVPTSMFRMDDEEKFSKVLRSIDIDSVTTIELTDVNEKELLLILKTFPKLQTLKLNNIKITDEKLSILQHLLYGRNIGIEFSSCQFPKTTKINSECFSTIEIRDAQNLKKLILTSTEKNKGCQSLLIDDCPDLELQISDPKISSIKAKATSVIKSTLNVPSLTEISISSYSGMLLDLSSAPLLQRYQLPGLRSATVKLHHDAKLLTSSTTQFEKSALNKLQEANLLHNDAPINFDDFPSLREFNLEHGFLTFDNIENTQLKKIHLYNCETPHELNLRDCTNLSDLTILFTSISSLALPNNLKSLCIGFGTGAPMKCDMANLPLLKKLEIRNNTGLENLPFDIAPAYNLEELTLIQVEENIDVSSFQNLQTLRIEDGFTPKKLDQLDSLRSLYLFHSHPARDLDISLSSLSNLEELFLKNLTLDSFALPKLKNLNLLDVSITEDLNLSHCPQLKTIKLSGTDTDNITMTNMEQLEHLEFNSSYNSSPVTLNFQNCPKLRTVKLSDNHAMVSFESDVLESLEVLVLERSKIDNINWSNLPNLKSLCIRHNIITSGHIYDLSHLQNLEELELESIEDLSSLNLGSLPKLRRLVLHQCDTQNGFDFSKFPALEQLIISQSFHTSTNKEEGNYGFDITHNKNLRTLKLLSNGPLDLNLKNNKDLEYFQLDTKEEMMFLDLRQLTQLKQAKIKGDIWHIDVSGTHSLNKLDVDSSAGTIIFGNQPSLKQLALVTTSTPQLSNIASCTNLRTIDVTAAKYDVIEKNALPPFAEVNFSYKTKQPEFDLQKPHTLARLNYIPLEVIQRDQENQKNPVSVFSFMPNVLTTDADTKSAAPYTASGGFTAVIKTSEPISTDHYRIQLYDRINYSKSGEVMFTNNIQAGLTKVGRKKIPSFDEKTTTAFINFAEDPHKNMATGYFKGKFVPGEYYPLPSINPLTQGTMSDLIDIFCNPPDAIDVFWNRDQNQYFIRLKENAQPRELEIFYLMGRNADYSQAPGIWDKPQNLLPTQLNKRIEKELAGIKELAFLFDSKLSLKDKMDKLTVYCHFEEGELLKKPIRKEDILFDVIKNRKGVCRHSSEAFTLLSHYLGVPTRMVENEQHRFCEVPSVTNGQASWHRVDLGGGIRFDITPPNVRQDPLKASHEKYIKEMASKPTPAPRVLSETELIANAYYKKFIDLVQPSLANSLSDLLDKKHNPLILMEGSQNAFSINTAIVKQLGEKAFSQHLYIHSAADFRLYLSPYTLQDGERTQIKGPLADLIKNGGVLVINWANFTPTEIASYKSILDKHRTLLGQDVSEKLNIIGIASLSTESSSAFLSRCKPYTLQKKFFDASLHISEKSEDITELPTIIDINLFNRLDWQEELLGEIKFKGDSIVLQPGNLYDAVVNGKKLVINNPPKSAEFDLLLYRIQHERKFFYNGQLLKVSPNFSVELAHKPAQLHKPNVKVHTDEKKIDGRKKINIGLYNLHECIEQLKISNKQAESATGLFDRYDAIKHVFYLTDSITEADWQLLLSKMPEKPIEFVLAPGVEIEHVAKNDATDNKIINVDSYEQLPRSTVISSNDIDLCTAELASSSEKEEVLIVNLTPQTTFSDLMYEEKNEKRANSSKMDFFYEEKAVLSALRDSKKIKKVILNGDISPSLYQQLLPYFNAEQSTIVLNGEEAKLSGQLYAVIPENSILLQAYPNTYYNKRYDWNDYSKRLPHAKTEIGQLELFYNYAKAMPHRGMGRPKQIQMDFTRVKNLVSRIQNPSSSHIHNPIKSLFNYDYPKDSEDYAYLNVVAKYLFASADTTPVRSIAINKLIERFNIQNRDDLQNHAWLILNCFRGAELQKILGPDLSKAIDFSSGFPKLTPHAQANLWQNVEPHLNVNASNKIEARLAPELKREIYLKRLIENPDNRLIIVKGAPGSGKSYTARKLKKDTRYVFAEGEKGILKWLTDPSEKPKILLLDEANMSEPGTWDFLKGLTQDHKQVYYQGKNYKLSDQHKIIVTCNPENFPKRYYHDFFQSSGETVYFATSSNDYLEKTILKNLLSDIGFYNEVNAKQIMSAYLLVQELNPIFTYSIRDLENVAQRLKLLITAHPTEAANQLIFQACIAEFAASIAEPDIRQDYITQLSSQLNVVKNSGKSEEAADVAVFSNYYIPSEKSYLIEGITQDLLLRINDIHTRKALEESATPSYYKSGILIEGDAGLGKSTLFKAILEHQGFRKDHEDPQLRYYEISAGDSEVVKATLLEAFYNGSVVILDELNLDESLEILLNQLLTGNGPSGEDPIRPGFMVMASQNPSYYSGTKSVSQALRNRIHVMYMEAYSHDALVSIARANKIDHPEEFVIGFERAAKDKGELVNMRTFFLTLADSLPATVSPQKSF